MAKARATKTHALKRRDGSVVHVDRLGQEPTSKSRRQSAVTLHNGANALKMRRSHIEGIAKTKRCLHYLFRGFRISPLISLKSICIRETFSFKECKYANKMPSKTLSKTEIIVKNRVETSSINQSFPPSVFLK
jgi:hypothetical protein